MALYDATEPLYDAEALRYDDVEPFFSFPLTKSLVVSGIIIIFVRKINVR